MLELIDAQGYTWQYQDGEYRMKDGEHWGIWRRGTREDVELVLHVIGLLPDVIEWKEVS